ncbi:MAG: hypothetical protein JRN26_07010 [Nitrososphaerota archaeon]|nr:hypothetical protein [Nitrososphaerota archaeon]MDG6931206.1 hypothetical protein [Nitrososphaerota archaeon]MDG6931869.1 hypothetical protein [Nitrososphaerota archaeon]MDG6936611.1 hypothetical protein [Nitrososphaerota archaeon]MDG6944405.1 hypothetical protein [Nitrososphaerota archaeon]
MMSRQKNQQPPKYYAVEECPKCGYKIKRDFKDGDYVLKISGVCPKDNSPMFISMIYTEVEQPKK